MLFFSLMLDLEFIFFILNFLFLHLLNGLHTIFFDYIHEKTLSFYLITLVKISFIENLIHVISFFI